jgi:hypothetical protein
MRSVQQWDEPWDSHSGTRSVQQWGEPWDSHSGTRSVQQWDELLAAIRLESKEGLEWEQSQMEPMLWNGWAQPRASQLDFSLEQL